jgi:hypothetical protein
LMADTDLKLVQEKIFSLRVMLNDWFGLQFSPNFMLQRTPLCGDRIPILWILFFSIDGVFSQKKFHYFVSYFGNSSFLSWTFSHKFNPQIKRLNFCQNLG